MATKAMLDALVNRYNGILPPTVDFSKEFGVTTTVQGYDSFKDPLTQARYILLADPSIPAPPTPSTNGVAIVLGAGNHSFLGVNDALYQVFVNKQPTLLKMHPIQLPTTPILEELLQPLIANGYLRIVFADIATSQKLIYSSLVSTVHLTGGILTHDAIVWGATAEERSRRQATNDPLLKAHMHSELGAVTPYIICPGLEHDNEWTAERISTHATSTAIALVSNTSCNCLAAKVLLLPTSPLGDAFLAAFESAVAKLSLEPTWYPGRADRYLRWEQTMVNNGVKPRVITSKTMQAGDKTEFLHCAIAEVGVLSATAMDIHQVCKDASWTREEPFAPVLTVLRIQAASTEEYIDAAFQFADKSLWGNLSASVFAPNSAMTIVMDKLLKRELLYGTVVVNGPTLLGYSPHAYWGGPVGRNSLADAQSGVGTIGVSAVPHATNSIVVVPFAAAAALDPNVKLSEFFTNSLLRVLVRGWGALQFWRA